MGITKNQFLECFDLFFMLLLAASIMYSCREKTFQDFFLFLKSKFNKDINIFMKIIMSFCFLFYLTTSVYYVLYINLFVGLFIFTFSLMMLLFFAKN